MMLVREFAAKQSEPAFAALVERHIALIYSAALRQVGDAHLAEEITQAVFIIHARKAASLGPKTILSAWLYRTTRYASADALRARRRRQAREQEAHMQSILNPPDTDAWAQLVPLLDDALAELGETDRTALVLRFFERKTAREIAGALRMEEAAAQKRVARALEKLRALFVKRGVTLAATAIAGAVAANSVQAAPVGLAATVAATAAKGTTVAASIVGLVKGTTKLMAWAKFKFAAGVSAAALLAGGTAGVLVLHSTKAPSYNPALARQMIQAVFSRISSPLPEQMRFVLEVESVQKPWTEAQIRDEVARQEESARKYQEKAMGIAKWPKTAQEQWQRAQTNSREIHLESARAYHGTRTFVEQEWFSSGSSGLWRLDQTETTPKSDKLRAVLNPNPLPAGVDYASTLVNIGDPHFSDLTSWRIDYALCSAELNKGGPGASKWETENSWEVYTIEPSIAFVLTFAGGDLMDIARQAQTKPHSDIDSFAGVKLDTNKLEALLSGKDSRWIVETDEAVLNGRKMAVLRLKGKTISPAPIIPMHGVEVTFFADASNVTNIYRIELTGIPLMKTPYTSIRDDFDTNGFPHTWIVETPKESTLKKTVKFKEVELHARFDDEAIFLPEIPAGYSINGGRAENTHALLSEEETNSMASIPTGKLAFVTSENFGNAGKIIVIEGHHQTTTPTYQTREIEFLPEGKRIIYSANDSQGNGIYIYDLMQHTNIPLMTKVEGIGEPSLSPDGTKIAFVIRSQAHHSSQIFTANADGSGPKQLTEGQYFNWTPRWSPDGKKLVFETTRNDSPATHVAGGYRDIYVMDSDGQNQTNLTRNTFGHHPSWSPDGKSIAYMARGIIVMKTDGSDKQNISQGKTRDSEPVWSPDGQWIAFTRTANKPPGPETMDIWIMKRDGTEQHPVTFNKTNFASFCPTWSK